MLGKGNTIETYTCANNYVKSGDIKIGTGSDVLISSPLGSCIAVIAYDAQRKIGGIAHIMLPGKSPVKSKNDKNKYAIDAIETLLSKLYESGVQDRDIEACLIGGANVLKKETETLTRDITDSVCEAIEEREIKIRANSLGGFERRGVTLDIKTGMVCYTIGESAENVLWQFLENEDSR